MGELDFVVKKGLNVKNGDVTITSGNLDLNNGYADIDNIKIDGNSIISTDTNGNIDLTPNGNGEVNISKVDINGGTLGGITIDGNWTAASQTCADLGTVTTANIDGGTADDVTIGGSTAAAGTFTALTATGTSTLTTVDINAGAIDGTTVGAASASTGAFTTLSATGAVTATNTVTVGVDDTGHDVKFFGATTGKYMLWDESADQLKIVGTTNLDGGLDTSTWATFNGVARMSTTQTQTNGDTKSGGASGSTLVYSESRLHSDVSNDDIDGAWNGYHGMANALILDNAENSVGGGQVVVFTEGRTATSGSGSSWALGRERDGAGKFTIGYVAKSYEDVGYAGDGSGGNPSNAPDVDSPTTTAQSFVEINTAGDLQLMKGEANPSEGRLVFTGAEDDDTKQTVSFKAPHDTMTASSSYTWPIAPAGGNDYVLTAQTNGTLAWAASASGADGMGAGFTVSATTDTTATTIVTGEDLFFAASGGLTAETTADGTVTHGLDINGLTAAAIASGDFLAFSDEATAGDPTKKESIDDIATLFAGTGLTASGAVIGVDAAQTQITSVGTIGTGTWQGTAIASAYLDADTAHLSGTQTFSGAKTFSANATLAGFILDGNTITNIDDSAEFNDSDAYIMTSAGINDRFGVIAGSSSIVTVGTITSGTWEGTAIASANLDADTAHLSGTQTFSGAKTFSASVDMNAGATIDGATISLDATTALNIDNSNTSNGISIGTATSAVPITIGHGTSETTFGDNVTISGNLTVNGAQTIIDSTTVISEDKTFILGLTGGMADATYARSGTTVTVTSASHGFSSNEYVLVQDAGNSITDDVYTITVTNTNTFTFTSPASGTVSGGATMLHSTNDTTEAIADGAGIYAPGTSLHSLQYDSSNGWLVSDDLDIANTKHISFNGSTKLTATEWFGTTANSMTSASSLATVGALGAGSITSGFGAIDNGTSNITTGGIFSIDVDNALTIATNVTGIGVAGSVTLGAGADAGLYVNGDNLYIENKTTDKDIIFRVSDNGTYTTVATIDGDVSLFNFVTDKLGINGTAVTSTAAELNLIDGSSVGTVANSKAVIYSAAGQVEGTTLGINSKAVIQTNANANASEGTSSSGGPIDIFSFAHATYRAAKILLSIDRVTSDASAALAYETAEILINHDGTNVYYTTYGYISSEATQLATITAAISGNDVVVKYDPVASSTDVFNFEAIATLIIV